MTWQHQAALKRCESRYNAKFNHTYKWQKSLNRMTWIHDQMIQIKIWECIVLIVELHHFNSNTWYQIILHLIQFYSCSINQSFIDTLWEFWLKFLFHSSDTDDIIKLHIDQMKSHHWSDLSFCRLFRKAQISCQHHRFHKRSYLMYHI